MCLTWSSNRRLLFGLLFLAQLLQFRQKRKIHLSYHMKLVPEYSNPNSTFIKVYQSFISFGGWPVSSNSSAPLGFFIITISTKTEAPFRPADVYSETCLRYSVVLLDTFFFSLAIYRVSRVLCRSNFEHILYRIPAKLRWLIESLRGRRENTQRNGTRRSEWRDG